MVDPFVMMFGKVSNLRTPTNSISNNDQSQGALGNSTVTDNGIKHHRAKNPGTAGISNNPITVNGNNNDLTPSAEGDVDRKNRYRYFT